MERVGVLIKRLLEQYEQHERKENLFITAQMLLAELQASQSDTSLPCKAAVVMPVHFQNISLPNETAIDEKVFIKNEVSDDAKLQNTFTSPSAHFILNEYNPLEEVPTLPHQNKSLEINDAIAMQAESLNDKLKKSKSDIGSTLSDAPVRDLRKAIGINDRFLFINELFRGDETMYERSVKTINSFNIFAEAEYWIRRELKIKIGWSDDNETVKLFDQLVIRRFS
jgi:hypothetical protein